MKCEKHFERLFALHADCFLKLSVLYKTNENALGEGHVCLSVYLPTTYILSAPKPLLYFYFISICETSLNVIPVLANIRQKSEHYLRPTTWDQVLSPVDKI
jgi:hypothetical protein